MPWAAEREQCEQLRRADLTSSRRFYSADKFSPEQVRRDEAIGWRTAKLFHGGQRRKVRCKQAGGVYWQGGQRRTPLRLLVVAPTPYRQRRSIKLYYRQSAYLLTSVYVPSPRAYPARVPEPEYPAGYHVRRVKEHGDIHFGNRVLFLSEVLAGEMVGLQEEDEEGGWRIWFGPVALAYLDRDELSRPPRSATRNRPRLPAVGRLPRTIPPWKKPKQCYPCAWAIVSPM